MIKRNEPTLFRNAEKIATPYFASLTKRYNFCIKQFFIRRNFKLKVISWCASYGNHPLYLYLDKCIFIYIYIYICVKRKSGVQRDIRVQNARRSNPASGKN